MSYRRFSQQQVFVIGPYQTTATWETETRWKIERLAFVAPLCAHHSNILYVYIYVYVCYGTRRSATILKPPLGPLRVHL